MSYNHETHMYEGFIYKIWNEANDKIYIGQTKTSIKERWHGHMSAALSERKNSHLYNAMRKYGRDKFHIEELIKVEKKTFEELSIAIDDLEKETIHKYKSDIYGYNTEHGGTGQLKKIPGKNVCKYDDNLNLIETYESISEAARRNNIDYSTVWAVCNHYYFRAAGYVWAYKNEMPRKPPIYNEKIKVEKVIKPKKEIVKLTEEEKRTKRLKDMGIENKKIIKYNAFGEIIAEYKNPFDAEKNISISMSELKLNLNGNNLKYKDFVLRYEDVSFDFYPMSKYLNPVVLYDLQGNYVNRFKSHQDAEKYLGITRGELTKVLKRGGSVKKYLVSEYGKEIKRKTMRLEHTYEMLSDDYKVIKTFNTYKEIANMFGLIDCSTCVLNAIRNNTMYRGFYWRFKDEYPINDYIV